MSILVNKNTQAPRPGHHRLAGTFHAKQMLRVRHATSSAASRRARAARSSKAASRSSTPSPRR